MSVAPTRADQARRRPRSHVPPLGGTLGGSWASSVIIGMGNVTPAWVSSWLLVAGVCTHRGPLGPSRAMR